jgi:hypothetical protein
MVVSISDGRVNEKPICGLPLDSVTTMLGRPSGVEAEPTIASIAGPQLHYHRYGLSFWFSPESKSPEKGAWMVTVYLSKTWDRKFTEFFSPFSGTISPPVSPQWKASQIETAFPRKELSIRTAEQHRQQLEATGVRSIGTTFNHVIVITFASHRANFIHEATTKFLEQVVLVCGSTSTAP